MNVYKNLLELCGLSKGQAVVFHKVSIDTVKSWCSGRRNPPIGVITELKELWVNIECMSDEVLNLISEKQPEVIELAYCRSDADAQVLGLPFKQCHDRALAIIAANVDVEIDLVPRSQSLAAYHHEDIL